MSLLGVKSFPPYVKTKTSQGQGNLKCLFVIALFHTGEFCMSSAGNALDSVCNGPLRPYHEASYPECVSQSVSGSCLLIYPASTKTKQQQQQN